MRFGSLTNDHKGHRMKQTLNFACSSLKTDLNIISRQGASRGKDDDSMMKQPSLLIVFIKHTASISKECRPSIRFFNLNKARH